MKKMLCLSLLLLLVAPAFSLTAAGEKEPDPGQTRAEIPVTGMTCGHCQQTVENALKSVDGVYAVLVDLEGMTAEIDYDDTRSAIHDLTTAVEGAGYGADVSD